ncbi:MAG: L-threonylcarbamoyladenylate synthase [Eubacteriales bacterium]|nr:L-threonylcarbamoyladenylate synthase [Eubacteriales bacterium]
MKTRVFEASEPGAGELIRNGGLVAVPTETVYGLAGNGLDEAAVRKIYEVKGRPAVKPLSLMVPGKSAMKFYCDPVPQDAEYLAEKFWPGPLTIVLNSRSIVPEIVRAGGETVGLRCPDSAPTLSALKEAAVPFAAPSANPSGEPSPKSASEVLNYFDGTIDGIIDGGECVLGTESTLIAMNTLPYRILRQGALPYEMIADALAENMTVIGVTGPTGCGKTSVLDFASEVYKEDCFTVDCDRLYHSLLAENAELNAAILMTFPEASEEAPLSGVVHVDRKKLSGIVFEDADKLCRLNEVTHPFVVSAVKDLIRQQAMNGKKIFVIDASELIGSGADLLCSVTVSVLAPLEDRIQRIMNRDGLSRFDAEKRIKAQHEDAFYSENTMYSIGNDGTFEEYRKKVLDLLNNLIGGAENEG